MYKCVHVQHVSIDQIHDTESSKHTHLYMQTRERERGVVTQHSDPQTLNGVGVKGLVGEGRRKSLLRLSPPYREETNGNNFRRQHIRDIP